MLGNVDIALPLGPHHLAWIHPGIYRDAASHAYRRHVHAYNITVIDVPKSTIVNATDAIVRITASAICGSDLHSYHQDLGSPENPSRIGHEAIGYIEEVGDSVEALKAGDWVVIPFALDNGHYQYGPSIDSPLVSETGM